MIQLSLIILFMLRIYIMTHRPIARQRISKQASLTIEVVFSAWLVQIGYKAVFSSVE
jgi:hypothetical protein